MRGERILTALRNLSAHVAGVASIALAIVALSRGISRGSFTNEEAWLVQRNILATMLGLMTLCLAFVAVSHLTWAFLASRARLLEVVSCMYIPAIMVIAMATDRYYMTRLMGFDQIIHGADDFFSDTRVLLALDATLSFVHLFMPVRWCLMVFVELTTVAIYLALAYGLGSPEKRMVLSNLGLLCALTISSALGLRSIERRDRESFASIAQERVLRVMAEAQLGSSAGSHSAGLGLEEGRSEHGRASTVASTAPTDRYFIIDPADTALDIGERLGDLGLVGNRELWLLDHKEVRLNPDEVLGEGGFGLVVGGRLRGSPVAVKVPKDPANAALNNRHFAALVNELRMMRLLRHPNIVMLYGACIVDTKPSATAVLGSVDTSYLALVLERVDGISLTSYIERGATLAARSDSEQSAKVDDRGKLGILLGVCHALQYLHSLRPPIVHGDLKPCNIMVEVSASGARAKLVDFGLSCKLTRHTKTLGGSLGWMPPEAINHARPCTKSDVFAFGRIMFFVMCETLPVEGLARSTLLKSLRKNRVPPLKWTGRSDVSPACKGIVEHCTAAAVVDRPTIADVAVALEAVLKDNLGEESGEREVANASDFHSLVMLAGRKSKEAAARKKKNKRQPSLKPEPAPTPSPTPTAAMRQRTRSPIGMPRGRNRGGGLEVVTEEEERDEQDANADVADSPLARVHDCFDLTPEDVRELTVVDLIMRWNVVFGRCQCCKYHAVLVALQKHVGRLSSSKCKLEYMMSSGGTAGIYRQCQGCFLVQATPAAKCCEFCGYENGVGEAELPNPDVATCARAPNCLAL